jgi:hypothetical protein
MIATPLLTSRGLGATAKRRLAASSVAPVASGYERGWVGTASGPGFAKRTSASDARFSWPETALCSERDR